MVAGKFLLQLTKWGRKIDSDNNASMEINMLENNFTQYQMGLFTEDYWREAQSRIENWYNIVSFASR